MKNQFYFKGKYFDNEEDFWNATNQWLINPITQEDLDSYFEDFKKAVILNLEMREKHLNGQELNYLFGKMFEAFSSTL